MGLEGLQAVRPSLRRPGLRDEVFGTSSDRYAPGFTLFLSGNSVGEFGDESSPLAALRNNISQVRFEENEDIQSEIKIKLTGFVKEGNRETPMPLWVESTNLFSDGNIVWLYGGYGGVQSILGGAEIVKRKFNYGDQPSVEITARDPIHRMANEFAESSITYRGLRSSDIVKKIGRKYSGAYGGVFNVDQIQKLPIFTPRAEVQKQGESDYHFIRRMAEIRGWSFFSRFNPATKKFDLIYGPDTDKQQPIFVYEYNADDQLAEDRLIDFDPEISVIDQHTEIKIVSMDEARKKKVGHSVKYKFVADGALDLDRKFTPSNADAPKVEVRNSGHYRLKAFGISRRVLTNRPFKDESEAKKFLVQWGRSHVKNFITAKGRVVGNESMQVRQVNVFKGIGSLLGGTDSSPGKWYFTKVAHDFSGTGSGFAYSTEFDCRKVVDWIPDDEIVLTLPALEKAKAKKTAKYQSVADTFTSGNPQ